MPPWHSEGMSEDVHEPPLTEAEYAASAEAHMQLIADKLTAALPDEVRDKGWRFGWATGIRPHHVGGFPSE